MTEEDETPRETEGEIEYGKEGYESLHSAKDHLKAAVDDVRQFVDRDFEKLAKDAVDKLDEKVAAGISSAADAMIEALQDLKERLRKEPPK